MTCEKRVILASVLNIFNNKWINVGHERTKTELDFEFSRTSALIGLSERLWNECIIIIIIIIIKCEEQ